MTLVAAQRAPRRRRGAAAVAVLAATTAAWLASGCSASLVERAVAARGGAVRSVSRAVEADVYAKVPGTWHWRIDYRTPDLLRWTLETWGEEQTYAFDGETVRLFLGSTPVASDPGIASGVRSQVRWIALTMLDVLTDDRRVSVDELSGGLPPGARAGLRVTWRDDGSSYRLYFDERDLLVAASGPIALPLVGAGELTATFADFRKVGGFVLPHRGHYALDGDALLDERVLRWVPNDATLTVDAFTRPPRRETASQ
jgi:hypothetical protein